MARDDLSQVFTSPNVADRNGEDANVVDVLDDIARAIRYHAHTIFPQAMPNSDAAGTHVASLTEAIMGMTAAIQHIADGLETMAEAVELAVGMLGNLRRPK